MNVGVLRARAILHFAPCLRDFVVTGHDRNEIGVLAVPDVDACRALLSRAARGGRRRDVLTHPAVRDWVVRTAASFAARSTGSEHPRRRAL